MRRISSKTTFLLKRVFPLLWFGFLAVFTLIVSVKMFTQKNIIPPLFLVPLVMGGIGYLVMKFTIFDLVDEVWDNGEEIIVRNKGKEERIPLTNIINVSDSNLTRPPRITLTLREPCSFGRDITFSPPARFFPFSKNPIATELIQRIDEKRRAK